MIYVDEFLSNLVPKRWQGGGHMFGTDIAELHAFAEKVGLRREWFQARTFAHYDLTRRMRQEALDAGAVPIEAGELPDDVLMRKRDGTYEPRHERLARRRAQESA